MSDDWRKGTTTHAQNVVGQVETKLRTQPLDKLKLIRVKRDRNEDILIVEATAEALFKVAIGRLCAIRGSENAISEIYVGADGKMVRIAVIVNATADNTLRNKRKSTESPLEHHNIGVKERLLALSLRGVADIKDIKPDVNDDVVIVEATIGQQDSVPICELVGIKNCEDAVDEIYVSADGTSVRIEVRIDATADVSKKLTYKKRRL